jgi:NADH-quinone oxidoreductase subunit H
MQDIIKNQGVWPWMWHITNDPFTAASFFIMFTSLVAESNRPPFDIPEAESELVSGYNTEYSGMRFLIFYFAEWANMYVVSAIITTLYLGGWNSPFAMVVHVAGSPVELSSIGVFIAKSLFVTFLLIWIRWSLPRLRVDQLMDVCWKYLIPIAFVNVVGVLVWMLIFSEGSPIPAYIMTVIFALVLILFVYKVVTNLVRMKQKLDFNPVQ